MSCYMVDDETINRVVSHLIDHQGQSQPVWEALRGLGFSMMEPEKLGQAMYDLNIASVTGNYCDETAKEIIGQGKYRYSYEAGYKIQVLKSLRCYLYQAGDGNMDKDPLFIALDDFSMNMALALLSETPEYQKAKWG